jgi:hypothetical protein
MPTLRSLNIAGTIEDGMAQMSAVDLDAEKVESNRVL